VAGEEEGGPVDQYLDTLYRYKKPTQVMPIKRKQPAWGKGGQKGTQLPQNPNVNELFITFSFHYHTHH
jgi:hypothetical protein